MSDQSTSTFDSYLEASRNQLKVQNRENADVMAILQSAGVSESGITAVLSNRSTVDIIRRHPDLAREYAKRYPAAYAVTYYEKERELGFAGFEDQFAGSGGADALAYNELRKGAASSDAGAIRYPNGVMVDPTTRQVIFPPNDPSIKGSPAWLQSVSDWSDEQVGQWRETLADAGYIESKKGGATVDFIDALATYHWNRFLYGNGKPVKLTDAASEEAVTAKDFDGLINKDVLKGEVRGWIVQAYGTPAAATDPKVDFLASKIHDKALQIAQKRGLSPSGAAGVARAKVQENFLDNPETKLVMEAGERRRGNTEMADSIISVAQILGSY